MTIDFDLAPQTETTTRSRNGFSIPVKIKLAETTSSKPTAINWLQAMTEVGTDNPGQYIRVLPDDIALERSALEGDEHAFVQAARQIDWKNRQAHDYVRIVRLALQAGAHGLARQLAQEGSRKFPEHSEMQQLATLLAPAKIISPHLPLNSGAGLNMRWIKEHRNEYRGQWVALDHGQLLGVAPTAKELLAQIEDPHNKNILTTKVY